MIKRFILFVIECTFAAGLIMFVTMAAGEIFIRPDLFGGFLSRPITCGMVFVESAIWTLPTALIGLLLLRRFNHFSPSKFMLVSTVSWLAFGVSVIVAYKLFYFPNKKWHVSDTFTAEILFGWLIPCILIWIAFVRLSMQLRVKSPSKSYMEDNLQRNSARQLSCKS